ncbi:TPA: hypothetical protein ACIRVD_004596, partial [Enterobacter roggenkampii]
CARNHAGWRLRLIRPTKPVGPVSAAPPGMADRTIPRKKEARILKKGFINAEKQKPSLWLGSLNSGAGLGIENFFYHIDINIIYLV